MSSYDLLKNIIEDIDDTIDDYEDSIRRADSNLEKHNYKIRKHELMRWKCSLSTILLELED